MLLALLTGGTLFCTLYVLAWYGTLPVTLPGKIIYGLFSGAAAFFIMGGGTSPVGYVYTILIMNMVSPVIQVIEERHVFSSLQKNIVPHLKMMEEVPNA